MLIVKIGGLTQDGPSTDLEIELTFDPERGVLAYEAQLGMFVGVTGQRTSLVVNGHIEKYKIWCESPYVTALRVLEVASLDSAWSLPAHLLTEIIVTVEFLPANGSHTTPLELGSLRIRRGTGGKSTSRVDASGGITAVFRVSQTLGETTGQFLSQVLSNPLLGERELPHSSVLPEVPACVGAGMPWFVFVDDLPPYAVSWFRIYAMSEPGSLLKNGLITPLRSWRAFLDEHHGTSHLRAHRRPRYAISYFELFPWTLK